MKHTFYKFGDSAKRDLIAEFWKLVADKISIVVDLIYIRRLFGSNCQELKYKPSNCHMVELASTHNNYEKSSI